MQYSMVLDFCNLCATAIIPFDGNKELLDCIGYIRTHVNTPVSVADVAHVIHRSESYTMKLFHDELGITISHFVNRCKLEEAKSLLSHTEMTLSEISNYLSPVSLSLHLYKLFSDAIELRKPIWCKSFSEYSLNSLIRRSCTIYPLSM